MIAQTLIKYLMVKEDVYKQKAKIISNNKMQNWYISVSQVSGKTYLRYTYHVTIVIVWMMHFFYRK